MPDVPQLPGNLRDVEGARAEPIVTTHPPPPQCLSPAALPVPSRRDSIAERTAFRSGSSSRKVELTKTRRRRSGVRIKADASAGTYNPRRSTTMPHKGAETES